MKSLPLRLTLLAVLFLRAPLPARAGEHRDEKDKSDKQALVYTAAVLPFQERGRDVKDEGSKVSDLLFAKLATDPRLMLVDREDVKKLLEEQELNLSGLINPQQATKAGQLTGAKLLITGSVLQVDNTVYLVAKIIGTETSRVVGASVKGNVRDDLGKLVDELGTQIGKTIAQRADDLLAKPLSREDRLAALKKKLGEGKRPAVLVEVPERHIGRITIDPAAATEVALFCRELGLKVIDAKEGRKQDADILLQGEAFSELAVRHGNLISVKARLELKAVDQQSGEIVAVDRQTTVAVDLTEQIAAKNALQEAGAALAERLLPKLVKAAPDRDRAGRAKRK
jgi:TolB-like protein